jgi:UDPglucose--hexose-1-phosphate uridylyltransferase
MEKEEIENVVSVWMREQKELGEKYSWIQIFENRGKIIGSSNPHPHGQIWASDFIPNEAVKEIRTQKKYFEEHGSPLLLDYISEEKKSGDRIVYENSEWLALTPFWAVWPFETILLPKKHILGISKISGKQKTDLAEALKILLTKYDNLFNVSFPYTMGWHGAPTDGKPHEYWQLHAHFYPPLLRSAEIKKFMVGYEMLAEAQRDITPEQAAEKIRSMPELHFKKNN